MIESIFFNPWVWIVGILVGIGLVVTVLSLVMGIREWGNFSGWWLSFCFVGILTLIGAAFYFGGLLPPYDSSFYHTYRITGEVTNVESAFSGSEGMMSQVFVAQVEGIDEFIKSDDQRFRTVEAGDDVNLVCTKQFRYFQEPWYDCNFGGK